MDSKKKILEINKSIRRASALTKEAIASGDKYKDEEINLLLEEVKTLKDMLISRLEKEESRLTETE